MQGYIYSIILRLETYKQKLTRLSTYIEIAKLERRLKIQIKALPHH